MNANELKNHLREWMRKPADELAAHLREAHGITGDLPKLKTKLVQLHGQQDHRDAPEVAEVRKDAEVLAGVTRKPEEAKAPARTRKAPARKVPMKEVIKVPDQKAPAKAAPKPATRTRPAKAPAKTTRRTPPAPPAESNGSGTSRETNQAVARKLAALAAEAFGSESPEVKAKVAYWLHSLPTGSEAGTGSWGRWWPESLPRPETADWRKPE